MRKSIVSMLTVINLQNSKVNKIIELIVINDNSDNNTLMEFSWNKIVSIIEFRDLFFFFFEALYIVYIHFVEFIGGVFWH